jgi:hypothetical protein
VLAESLENMEPDGDPKGELLCNCSFGLTNIAKFIWSCALLNRIGGICSLNGIKDFLSIKHLKPKPVVGATK